MSEPKFLLGFGERLTRPVPPPQRTMDKKVPYSVIEARNRLVPQVETTVSDLAALPSEACPNDQAVAVFTLHPEFLAKSYYPVGLLRELKLETVGSRPAGVQPEKTTRKTQSDEVEPSTELFVAGPRSAFSTWSSELASWSEATAGADDLTKIERVSAFTPQEKLRGLDSTTKSTVLLEVALLQNKNNPNLWYQNCLPFRILFQDALNCAFEFSSRYLVQK